MSVRYDFSGKIVWVTGAGRGIGFTVAKAFADSGAKVVGLDIKFDNGTSYPFRVQELDVTDQSNVKTELNKLLNENPCLDVLVSAAGVLKLGATDELSPSDWQTCFDVNVTGVFNIFQQTIPVFRRQGYGSIVVVASNSAHAPRIGMSAYGASKAAVRSLSQSVGLELAPYGVRCNIVSPGSTDTEMLRGMFENPEEGITKLVEGFPSQFKLGIPLKKIAQPTDVTQAVLYLASDAAGHVILQDIVVDGGATLGA